MEFAPWVNEEKLFINNSLGAVGVDSKEAELIRIRTKTYLPASFSIDPLESWTLQFPFVYICRNISRAYDKFVIRNFLLTKLTNEEKAEVEKIIRDK